jgi:hypothetical protein
MSPHSRVAVSQESLLGTIVIWRASHSGIPELQAWGETPEAAVANLAGRLGFALEDATDLFHRGLIQQTLADVHAVLGSSSVPEPEPVGHTTDIPGGSSGLALQAFSRGYEARR